ncbi:MAG: NADH-quinone oxidoreductase subunit NuoG [Candidatus Tectomicrobia bacterium]|uniref:NADH-quinone oxidoreductase n=1 Tax=Tectimicrobiota bacterium TaxID=2528274 RepID=A0A932CLA9_UNCTE|nr:NADH-quinone oxidoreductase subunit NuoG [Candidatus Tectomicrobia bacterium]
MPKIKINQQEIEAEPGTTILRAALGAGIEIPHFCYHPKLSIAGNCRMCLVELKGAPKLVIACNTAVTEGMEVFTDTPKVVKARQGVVEFLLINHPLDCPICDRGGECPLQNYTLKYGPTQTRYEEGRRTHQAKSLGPKVVQNQNRCILCGRCVRFLRETAGQEELGMFHRGDHVEVGTYFEQPLESPFTGNITDICPVGALTTRDFRFKVRVWELQRQPSVCSLCSCGCNLNLWTKDDRVYRITPWENPAVNETWICDRGRFDFHFIESPERLTTPLLRKDGALKPASWEEAYGFVAAKLAALSKDGGGCAIGGILAPHYANEEAYLFQKLLRETLGSNHLDSRFGPASEAHTRIHEQGLWLSALPLVEEAELIVLLGEDLTPEHPIHSLRIRKAVRQKGAQLIVAHSRPTGLDGIASHVLRYPEGQEERFLAAWLRVLLQEMPPEQIPPGIDEERWSALKALAASAAAFPLERELQEVAERMARTHQVVWAIHDSPGREASFLERAVDLVLLSKRPEDRVHVLLLSEGGNAQGLLDMGVSPKLLPGLRRLTPSEVSRAEEAWGVSLPSWEGMNGKQMLEAAHKGELKALYLVGVDPAGDAALGKEAEEALKKLELLVVQGLFLDRTAQMAHVVLPGLSFAEKDGTLTNATGRVQRQRRVIRPLAGARSDGEILAEIAARIAPSRPRPSSSAKVFQEIAQRVDLYQGLSYEEIAETGVTRPLTTHREG